MDIREKIVKQLDAGFSANEIRSNLAGDGYSREEIDRNMRNMPANPQATSNTSPWRLILSGALILIAIIRLIVRLSN